MGGIKVEKIKIKNLIFSYPNSEKTALNDINLTINQGEFCDRFAVNPVWKIDTSTTFKTDFNTAR